jgi:hypothetical protein
MNNYQDDDDDDDHYERVDWILKLSVVSAACWVVFGLGYCAVRFCEFLISLWNGSLCE